MRKLIIISVVFILLNGCAIAVAPKYNISADNHVALKKVGIKKTIGIAKITQSNVDMSCRLAGDISIYNRMTYAGYVKGALIDELNMMDVYSEGNADIVISGNLNKVEFSSVEGYWDIELKLTSSNGKSITVQHTEEFESAYNAALACRLVTDAFMPAVQGLLHKIFTDPKFKTLLTK